jgi:hypothetical protein
MLSDKGHKGPKARNNQSFVLFLMPKTSVFIDDHRFAGFQMSRDSFFLRIHKIPVKGRFIKTEMTLSSRGQFPAVSGIGV